MNKTLKFLLAIALFVAILAIATGVNAAQIGTAAGDEYADLVAAANGEKNVAANDQLIKQEGNTYTVLKSLFVEELGVPSGSIILVKNGASLTVKNKVELDNTVTIFALPKANGTAGTGTVTFTGTMTVKTNGVLYTNIAKPTKVYGRAFVNGTAVANIADTTELTLKTDSVKGKPVVDNKETVYATLIVPEATLENNISMTFDLTYAGEKVNKLEVGKKYDFTIVAKYANYELDKTMITAVNPSKNNDEPANIDDTAIDYKTENSEGTITIPTGLKDGDKILMTVTIAGEEKDLAVVVGTVQPTPTATAEPTEAPATTAPATDDANKGDKDETPKTGDQIIPATALLAVVVVANVVYFAKSKRS